MLTGFVRISLLWRSLLRPTSFLWAGELSIRAIPFGGPPGLRSRCFTYRLVKQSCSRSLITALILRLASPSCTPDLRQDLPGRRPALSSRPLIPHLLPSVVLLLLLLLLPFRCLLLHLQCILVLVVVLCVMVRPRGPQVSAAERTTNQKATRTRERLIVVAVAHAPQPCRCPKG